MTVATFIFRKKAATLVEYQKDGVPVRVVVPSDRVRQTTDGSVVEVSDKTLREGIPYGVPWSIHIEDTAVTGADIEKELHRFGIWTIEDYRKNPGAVQNAILAITANVMRSIAKTVKEYSSKEVTR